MQSDSPLLRRVSYSIKGPGGAGSWGPFAPPNAAGLAAGPGRTPRPRRAPVPQSSHRSSLRHARAADSAGYNGNGGCLGETDWEQLAGKVASGWPVAQHGPLEGAEKVVQ